MPRPLVEVRQSVLNPVVTINDPQQEVCIIGLHTASYDDELVHSIDLSYTAAAGDSPHLDSAQDVNFVLDVNGVFLDGSMDFGPDQWDLDGSQTLSLTEAWYSRGAVVGSNQAVNGSTFTSYTSTVTHSSSSFSGLNGILVAQPSATHLNKLVVESGDAVNFLTDVDFIDLSVGDTVKCDPQVSGTDSSLFVLHKTENALYLRGGDADSRDVLVTHTDGFALKDATGTVFTDTTRFKLEHAGIHEVTVSSVSGSTFTCSGLLPFACTANDPMLGALLVKVPDSDLPSLDVTEGESSLTVSQDGGTGDVAVEVDATKLVYGGHALVRADMRMSYVVARNDLSASLTNVDSTNYLAVLGAANPRNPLSLAAQVALDNSGASSVNVLGLDLTPVAGETTVRSLEQAFLDALGVVNRHATTYAMVPLTTSVRVTKAYADAAEALSAPRKGKFRICLGTSEGAPVEDYILGSPSAPAKLGSNTQEVGDPSRGVISNNLGDSYRRPGSKVLVNDTVTAFDGDTVYIGTVAEVTDTTLTVNWDTEVPTVASLSGYYVSRSLYPTTAIARQIELLTAQANSLASQRLFLTFPGACSVGEFTGLPAYYLTAAFSGLLARLEIHRPKNFIGLNGVSGLADFSRFTDDQLDAISDAGYLVFQQDEPTSAPYCVHQVNTYHGVAAGTQEYTELSVLSNFDFVSRYLKEVLDPYAGTVNIVPSTLGIIQASLDAAMANLRSRRVALIGAPLLSGSVQFVRQASYDAGTVEASVLVSIPKVLNKILLDVVSG